MQTPVAAPPPEAMIQRAREDAARRSGTAAEQARVARVEERQWPDTSLGCPDPDLRYAQVVTPGYLIVVEAAGQPFEYHADQRSRLVLCQDGRPAE